MKGPCCGMPMVEKDIACLTCLAKSMNNTKVAKYTRSGGA